MDKRAMTAAPIVYDGLWRLLCPSVDASALRRAIRRPHVFTRLPTPSRRLLSCSPAARRQARLLANTVLPAVDYASPAVPAPPSRASVRPTTRVDALTHSLRTCALDGVAAVARRVSVAELLRVLGVLAAEADGYARVVALVHYLVRERRCLPRLELYEALTRIMASISGSASALRLLLAEMDQLEIPKSPTIYRNALAALTIHPDYLLRILVLAKIHGRWDVTEMEDHQNIALGFLRDGQYEMALDKLEDMLEMEPVLEQTVAAWVLDVFAVALGRAGFLDEAVQVLLARLRRNYAPPRSPLLYYLLDLCAAARHWAGTQYLWARAVGGARLNVSDGSVANVLQTAVHHRDGALAGQAIQTLSDRGTRISLHHFESLVELQAGQGAVADALQTLCLMAQSGFVPARGTTRSLLRVLKQQPALLDTAFGALDALAAQFGTLPAAACDVLVEAAAEASGIAVGMVAFRAVQQHYATGPTVHAFLSLVFHTADPVYLTVLAAEFIAGAVTDPHPRPRFYDKLVWGCATTGSLDLAFALLHRARHLTLRLPDGAPDPAAAPAASPLTFHAPVEWWMRLACIPPLVKAAIDLADPRVWPLIETLERAAVDVRGSVRRLMPDTPAPDPAVAHPAG